LDKKDSNLSKSNTKRGSTLGKGRLNEAKNTDSERPDLKDDKKAKGRSKSVRKVEKKNEGDGQIEGMSKKMQSEKNVSGMKSLSKSNSRRKKNKGE